MKKEGDEHFDVTEGSFDGAEICELIGLYMLSKMNSLFKNGSVGLYRDDGLAVVQKNSGPQIDRLRKDIIKVFQQEGLQITIEVNLTVVDFLDIYLDLGNNKYYPYRKPNDTPLYVHSQSNHPQSILKQIPMMTSQRISRLSCDEEEFKKAAGDYQSVLDNSGYKEKLIYTKPKSKTRNRKRKVLWYNPPFDLQVKTNVAKKFLCLIDKHFPTHHKLHKILNRNCVKVSYSTMPNVASQISTHNINLLNKHRCIDDQPAPKCNCNDKSNCPLNGECQTKAIIYQADVITRDISSAKYRGLCETTFKDRFADHKCSFAHKRYSNKTELSNQIWKLKDEGEDYSVKFSILRKSCPYRAGSKYCNLCLWEKCAIMKGGDSLLNKKDELISKCRHINKFLFKNFKYRDK